jgi:hypothetical protein
MDDVARPEAHARALMSAAEQLELPLYAELRGEIVECVQVGKKARVRPLRFAGWVKFPRALREVGARYFVERLRPRPGGAWTAAGEIRRVA